MMKTLYLIGGTMGVGKTAVSQQLKHDLPNAVFLDGDWCWDASPFQVTEETRAMVTENICYLLNQFLHCPAYENVIFCWVMHQQEIIDDILERLKTEDIDIHTVSLLCDRNSLCQRLEKDIAQGIRQADIEERSLARLSLYEQLNTVKIDTSQKSPEEIAGIIAIL